MRTEIINGKEITVQERDDWKNSIDIDFDAGDYFDAEIAWDLLNALPPASQAPGYFQVGEPHDHRLDQDGRCRATYCTLKKVCREPEVWQYLGNCFLNEETEYKK